MGSRTTFELKDVLGYTIDKDVQIDGFVCSLNRPAHDILKDETYIIGC